MISHQYKCIFIHIQRCAGTSIETWIDGDDLWHKEPDKKHIIASQARSLYRDYWDDYFKFSIVRNPFSRTRSCLKYADHFGMKIRPGGTIDFSGYHEHFGEDIVIEYDHRFYDRDDLLNGRHLPGQVYGNIIDEPLDFIARFENLADDMDHVRRVIGHPYRFDKHVEASEGDARAYRLSERDVDHIRSVYEKDFCALGYSLELEQS